MNFNEVPSFLLSPPGNVLHLQSDLGIGIVSIFLLFEGELHYSDTEKKTGPE